MIADPYRILEVSSSASDEEITKSYRRLARKYHPDINRGNPDAAKRMTEINAAYEQIKEQKKNGNSSGTYRAGYGQGREANGQNTSGHTDGPFGFNPFEGFDFFSGGFGQRGPGGRNSGFDRIADYINAGDYQRALEELNGMADRDAEWYCYAAIANSGYGNKITALKYARTAVQMEPENREYRNILYQIENGGRVYRQRSQAYGVPTINMGKICLGLAISNLCCMLCGRPI